MLTSEDKNWAMACHLAALSGYLGVPFGHVVGPLLVWALKRDSSEFVDWHGKESINFHISLTLYGFLAGLLVFTAFGASLFIGTVSSARSSSPGGISPGGFLAMGLPVLFAIGVAAFLWIMATVCTVIAAIKASNGEKYLYPFAIQFFR